MSICFLNCIDKTLCINYLPYIDVEMLVMVGWPVSERPLKFLFVIVYTICCVYNKRLY